MRKLTDVLTLLAAQQNIKNLIALIVVLLIAANSIAQSPLLYNDIRNMTYIRGCAGQSLQLGIPDGTTATRWRQAGNIVAQGSVLITPPLAANTSIQYSWEYSENASDEYHYFTVYTGGAIPTPVFNVPTPGMCLNTTQQFSTTKSCSGNAFIGDGVTTGAASIPGTYPTLNIEQISLDARIKWAGPNASNSYQFIMYNGNSGSSGYGLYIDGATKKLGVLLGGVAFLTSPVQLTTGKWQQVTATRNYDTWSLWVDGIPYSLTNSAGIPLVPANGRFTIGQNTLGGQRFNGALDDVKVWTTSFFGSSSTDVGAVCLRPDGNVAGLWDFNEGNGSIARDGSGNGLDLPSSNPSVAESATYTWDFGDGTTATGLQVSHSYNSQGNKNVILKVTEPATCPAYATTTINVVNTIPAGVTPIVAYASTSCAGEEIYLSTSGGALLEEDFNGDEANLRKKGWDPANPWRREYYEKSWYANDDGPYAREGGLTSPAFSTLGHTGLNLAVSQSIFFWYNGTAGFVRMSTDKQNWVNLKVYPGTPNGKLTFAYGSPETVYIPIPATFDNKPQVYLQFYFKDSATATAGNVGWTIDNVKVYEGAVAPVISWFSNPAGYTMLDAKAITVTPRVTTIYSAYGNTGCVSAVQTIKITVNPKPAPTISGRLKTCAGDLFSAGHVVFKGSGAVAPYTFYYTINNGTEKTTVSGKGDSVIVRMDEDGIFRPSIKYTITRIVSANGCDSVPPNLSATVLVYQQPDASITSGGFCTNGAAGTIKMVGLNGTRPYTFYYSDAANNVYPAVSAAGSDTAQVTVPTTAGQYRYQILSVTDANGCANGVIINYNVATTATVYATPVLSLTPSYAVYCTTPRDLTATGATSYNWSPASGLSSTFGSTVQASPAVSTIYTVKGYNGVCSDSATVIVAATGSQPAPTASSLTPCYNSTLTLKAGDSLSTDVPVYMQDFNKPLTDWTLKNGSSNGTVANAAWSSRQKGYTYILNGKSFTFNPGSGFYMSNGSHQAAENYLTTSTSMQSPVFSTYGFKDMKVTLNDLFLYNPLGAAIAKVQLSTDGSNWTDISVRNGVKANIDSTSFSTTTFAIPAAFENKFVVYIRFAYNNNVDGLWWAINNLLITGTTTNTWHWTSVPTGFVSDVQNPTIASVTSDSTYYVTTTNSTFCTLSSNTAKVVVAKAITATIDTVVRVTPGSSSFAVNYTITNGSPDRFTVQTALPNKMPGWPVGGYEAPLDFSSFVGIPFQQQSVAGSYNFTWQATSSTSGCTMSAAPFRLIIGNNNNNLASLTSGSFTMSPVFNPSSLAYVATIDRSVPSVSVTPVAAGAGATITVNGTPVISGAASPAIAISASLNFINITVTAQDGSAKTYLILVKKTSNIATTGVTTDAKQAYSLRGLNNTYMHSTGTAKPAIYSVIRVRRSIDNLETDIVYNSTTFDLDTATLKAFASGGDAFITKWYDQSGNDLDAMQTVAASQPRIVQAGVIDRKNNVPTVYFGTTPFNNIFLTTAPFTGFANGVSIFAAAGAEMDWPYAPGSPFVSKTSGGQPAPFTFNRTAFVVGDASKQTTQAHNFNAATGFSVFGFTGALATAPVAYTNGVASSTPTNLPQTFNDAGTAVIIGSNAEGTGRLDGWISELVLFPQLTGDVDRTAITNSQIVYYLTPVINSVLPAASAAGTTVQIKGSIFIGVTAVKFGSVPAASYTVINDSLIYAVVPVNAGSMVQVLTSSHTGTFAGFTLLTPPGNTLYFNGVNNYVKTNTNPIAGNDFTIEFWMRTKQTGGAGGSDWYYGTGLVDGDVPGLANDFGISLLGNKICFGIGGASDVSISSKAVVNTGSWVHVAAVRSKTNGTISLFINGVRDTMHSAGTSALNDAALAYLTIAANRNLSSYFKGSIDELRFFNTDRSDVILSDMLGTVSQTLPAAYYTFDAGIASGNNIGANLLSDVTGNGNTMELSQQFALTDTISNWVESYAMVVPVATSATGITSSSFTANWTAPAFGVADSFKVNVATDAAFTHIVAGYDSAKVAGTQKSLTITGLAPNTTYYYRVRAHKTSVAGQGAYGPAIQLQTTALSITAVSPASAGVGTPVTITGMGFTGLTFISFGGTPALNFTLVSDNTIKAVVGNGSSGAISLSVAGNTVSKANAFTLLTQTPPGNALYFDGSTNYVKTGTNPIIGNDFTIEFWMKPNQAGATGTNWYNGTALVDGDLSGLTKDFGISLIGNKVCFGTGGTADFSIKSNAAVTLGQWVHVAAVRSKTYGTISLYINGQLDTLHSANTLTLAPSSLTYLTIGGNRALTTHFKGVIDELKFFNTDRSLFILNDMLAKAGTSTDGLAASYNFDEGIVGADNTGINLLVDQGSNNLTDTLVGFTNNTPSTIWTESYAMVVPDAGTANGVTTTGFTANWLAPSTGIVIKYYLDVSEKDDFSTFVTGYNNLDVGNVLLQNVIGLKPGTVYYYRVRAYKNSTAGIGASSATASVTTYNVSVWTGAVSTAWNNTANWGNNTVPTISDDVNIPAGVPNYPIVSTTAIAHGINIAAGASLAVIDSNTLSIAGDVANNGTFNASAGTLVFNGTLAQSITGGLAANNLTLNNAAGVTLFGGNTKVYGTYTPTAGKLNSNGYLVLASNTAGTAMIASTGDNFNYVSGLVTVERYIPAKPAWRLLTAPLSSTGSIFSNWQNNGSKDDSTGVELFSPNGTGPTGNGLTKAGVAASIKTYNSSGDYWNALENTNTTSLGSSSSAAANNAYSMFVTGPYGSNTITSASKATTLSATGLVQTGAQNFSFSGVDKDKYMLLGNPYASPIDFATIQKNNVNNTMWMWDAQLSGLGGYVMFSYDAITGTYDQDIAATVTQQTTVIQSGQAFFVQANSTNATAGVIIQESDKTIAKSNSSVVVTKPSSNAQQLSVTLNKAGQGIDGILVKLGDVYRQGLTDDGKKLFGYNENLSIKVDTSYLGIERMPLPKDNDSLWLDVRGMKEKTNYSFTIQPQNIPVKLKAYLFDKFLNTKTQVSLISDSTQNFTTTADKVSYAEDRFVIIFAQKEEIVLASNGTTVKAWQQDKDVQVQWTTNDELDVQMYIVEKSIDGQQFSTIETNTQPHNSGKTEKYTITDKQPSTGNNYYRVQEVSKDGSIYYSNVVVVTISKGKAIVSVYPNPVSRTEKLHITMTGMDPGKYIIQLFSSDGKPVVQRSTAYDGSTATQSISLPASVAAGSYKLILLDEKGNTWKQQVIIQ